MLSRISVQFKSCIFGLFLLLDLEALILVSGRGTHAPSEGDAVESRRKEVGPRAPILAAFRARPARGGDHPVVAPGAVTREPQQLLPRQIVEGDLPVVVGHGDCP